MKPFTLQGDWEPTGDQPEAIDRLTEGILSGAPEQTLLGVTGSGKTFTMAHVIARVQKPTLVIAPNKTLAAQLYGEFKAFFPGNAVEYFVSYYDYYQPEAYVPQSDTYIAKDASINETIDKMRHSATPLPPHPARYHHCGERLVHLRPGLSRDLPQHAARTEGGLGDAERSGLAKTRGDPVPAKRRGFSQGDLPRARGRTRSFPGLRGGPGLTGRVFRGRDRFHQGGGSPDREGHPLVGRDGRLPGDSLRDGAERPGAGHQVGTGRTGAVPGGPGP